MSLPVEAPWEQPHRPTLTAGQRYVNFIALAAMQYPPDVEPLHDDPATLASVHLAELCIANSTITKQHLPAAFLPPSEEVVRTAIHKLGPQANAEPSLYYHDLLSALSVFVDCNAPSLVKTQHSLYSEAVIKAQTADDIIRDEPSSLRAGLAQRSRAYNCFMALCNRYSLALATLPHERQVPITGRYAGVMVSAKREQLLEPVKFDFTLDCLGARAGHRAKNRASIRAAFPRSVSVLSAHCDLRLPGDESDNAIANVVNLLSKDKAGELKGDEPAQLARLAKQITSVVLHIPERKGTYVSERRQAIARRYGGVPRPRKG